MQVFVTFQGLLKYFPTDFHGIKSMKNTDLSVKILFQKCLTDIMEKLALKN